MDHLDQTLAALADPTRRAIVGLLADGAKSAGALGAGFDISAPALSRHLKVLRHCGLVSDLRDESDNRLRIYQLEAAAFGDLKVWLNELELSWQDQLASFKVHVESQRETS